MKYCVYGNMNKKIRDYLKTCADTFTKSDVVNGVGLTVADDEFNYIWNRYSKGKSYGFTLEFHPRIRKWSVSFRR